MKKVFLVVLAFCMLAVICCRDESGPDKEKKAIISVIEKEIAAYLDQDLEGLDAPWMHEADSRKMFMTSHGITELKGWDEIHQNNISISKRDWNEHEETAEFSNYEITIYGNTALVFHDSEQKIIDHELESVLRMRRIIHLVKVEDAWKIDLMAMYFLPHVPGAADLELSFKNQS